MKNLKLVLIGGYLLALAALLSLALDQAILLTGLYQASLSPDPAPEWQRLSFGRELFGLVIIAGIMFLAVFRHPRRLLPVSVLALLLFFGLNLYSGRHLLPQLLIWPTPPALVEQYSQSLAANDLNAALRLTDGSDRCQAVMRPLFETQQARLNQKSGQGGIHHTSVRNLTTFYEKPVSPALALMQPVPQQIATVAVALENDRTMWLNLKMSYRPFLGTRYLCGENVD